ncbi:MAG: TetR/AcrR family transcriptional regulator [Coriobacteriia bacterium]|nr:TetR/AcrR family transcriptional regulator [Coriobacteriia bacterium]
MAKRVIKPFEERRQEIISTARRFFIKNGYKNTSVAEIAHELGIAQGLIFHYFKSKAWLLYSVFDEIAAEERLATMEFLDEFEGRAIDCLDLFITKGTQLHDHLREYDDFFIEMKEDPAIQDYIQNKLTLYSLPMVQQLIERGNEDGSWNCDFPEQTAIFIISGFKGILQSYTDFDIAAMSDAIQSIVLRLLCVTPIDDL